METETLAAILGILVGVWLLRTAIPFFIKRSKEGAVFSLKFAISGLVSTLVVAVPVVMDEVALLVIVEGVHPLWIFLGAMVTSSGLADIINRYGITAWLPKELRTVTEAQTDTDSNG